MTKKKSLPRVYWDSTCFLAWLKPEPARKSQCLEVLREAQAGKLEIVTSTISFVEVLRLDKGPVEMTQDKEKKIQSFFKNDFIVPVQVTRRIAEDARELIWSQNLKKRDAIHAATAFAVEVSEFHAFDGDFDRLNGLERNGTCLSVSEPKAVQGLLDMEIPEPPEQTSAEDEGDEIN